MYFVERFTLTRAWTDLTDEEFFWEPVPNCWSVRPRAESRSSHPFGTGEWVVDFGGTVEPMTTIAWLLWHIGSMPGRLVELDFLGGTKPAESGWTSPYLADHPVFTSATDAVATLQDGWRTLESALQASTDEDLERKMRFWSYPGHPGPPGRGFQIVASILHEISHHGTQVCTLRDLYQATGGRTVG